MKKVFSIYGIADRNQFKYPGFVHDHNLCVTENGKLSNYMHLERITRSKYDNTLPDHIEDLLLSNYGISPEPDSVFLFVNSFVGSSFISKKGRIRFDCTHNQPDLMEMKRGYCWIQQSGWNGFEVEAYCISHEIAHAFSVIPFAGGLRENSLLISFDGGSSTGNFAAFHYKNGKMIQLESHWALSGLSKLYNDNGLSFGLINTAPGEHCSVPGKLMGYASWGQADEKIIAWLKQNNFFKDSWGERDEFRDKAMAQFDWKGSLMDNNDPFLFNVAATIQEVFRQGVLEKITQLADKTGADYLYYAGGCALNIVTNAELTGSGIFRDVFIPPCCNDSGLSLGAAAYYHFCNHEILTVPGPYLNNWNTRADYSLSNEDIRLAAEVLNQSQILAVCNGNGEAGPRALGNRSLLARADNKSLSEYLSMTVKGREWYRPVAPVMLGKNARIFTGSQNFHHLANYMLLDFQIPREHHAELSGVVHINGTARIQSINCEDDNPFLFHLLSYMEEKFGCRALINTSFNGKGEPIVQSPEDARSSARKMKLDNLIINGKYEKL